MGVGKRPGAIQGLGDSERLRTSCGGVLLQYITGEERPGAGPYLSWRWLDWGFSPDSPGTPTEDSVSGAEPAPKPSPLQSWLPPLAASKTHPEGQALHLHCHGPSGDPETHTSIPTVPAQRLLAAPLPALGTQSRWGEP